MPTQKIIDPLYEWLECIVTPEQTVDAIFKEQHPRTRFQKVAQIWEISFGMQLIVQLIVLYPVGLGLENISFQAIYLLISASIFFTGIVVTHCCLRLAKVKSSIRDLGVIYTVIFSPYEPIRAILSLPALNLIFSVLSKWKQAHTGFGPEKLLAEMSEIHAKHSFAFAVVIINHLSMPLWCMLFGLFIANVRNRFNSDIFRVVSGFGLAMVLSLGTAGLGLEVISFISFVFMKAAQ